MNKILCVVACLVLLAGCRRLNQSIPIYEQPQYLTGVWISFSELDAMLQCDFKQEFNTVIQNCKAREITDVFVHVRPYCDAYYNSALFPLRESARTQDFDVLKYMIDSCHQNNVKFHAWINPYRVKTADNDISTLPDNSPAKIWLSDQVAENDINVSTQSGVYLNPSSGEVRALIIDGVREIINNYTVDGIHFDDYFYPTTDANFDEQSYNIYCSNTKIPLSLDDYRRASVNALISGVYTAIKFKDKDIVFSVSPSASIEENYNKHYADVEEWIKSGCVDYIIPQLYFGFDYPDDNYKFNNLLSEWQKLTENRDVKLVIGLATYKIGTQNQPDYTEWANGKEVIKKQVEICRQNPAVYGHVYFSYTSMCEI